MHHREGGTPPIALVAHAERCHTLPLLVPAGSIALSPSIATTTNDPPHTAWRCGASAIVGAWLAASSVASCLAVGWSNTSVDGSDRSVARCRLQLVPQLDRT